MTAAEYVAAELAAGRLTAEDVAWVVRMFQLSAALTVDGRPGTMTRNSIDASRRFLRCPMPVLPDGRRAVITSGFKTRNPSRPDHDGSDFFYPYAASDEPSYTGNGGAAGRGPDGRPRWVVPIGVSAIAGADGRVSFAGATPTGHQVSINHSNGLQSIYNHLMDTAVRVGEWVMTGFPVGRVGDNPRDGDARHLHFGLRELGGEWLDPELFIRV
jgi:murein DD-endopeptidase MepM/ murein hydrolase activator NlpD